MPSPADRSTHAGRPRRTPILEAGHIIGNYEIRSTIAAGGMGVVYRAWHRIFQREAALKVLIPALALKERVRARFRQEAYLQAQLEHPHIIRVRDFIEDGETMALAMDLVDGPDLAQVLENERREPWTFDEMFVLLRPVLNAIGYAHARNVVHRDIKPANIVLDRGGGTTGLGMPRITDFGLGKIREDGDVVSLTGAKMGTLPYMAPEQFRGQKGIDARADVFALGVLVWRLVAGGFPFNPDDQVAVLEFYTGRTPLPRLDTVVDGLPDGMADLMENTLTIEKTTRPQDARALLEALKEIQAHAQRAPARPAPDVHPTDTETTTAIPASRVTSRPPQRSSNQDATETQTNLAVPVSAMGTTPQVTGEAASPGSQSWIGWLAAAALVVAGLFVVISPDANLLSGGSEESERPARSTKAEPESDVEVAVQTGVEVLGEVVKRGTRKVTGGQTDRERARELETKGHVEKLPPPPEGMAVIPAGRYGIGCLEPHDQNCFQDETYHQVDLTAFAIMKREVTMEQYDICVAEKGCPKPKLGGNCSWQKDGWERHPVNCVTWAGARHYCDAQGWRLPTELEWEAAARGARHGAERRDFPWGDDPPSCEDSVVARGKAQACTRSRSGLAPTENVGQHSADSIAHQGEELVYDLGGSVREWTASEYVSYPGGWADKDALGMKVNRGGSWAMDLSQLSTTHTRGTDKAKERQADLGFRCAADLRASPP